VLAEEPEPELELVVTDAVVTAADPDGVQLVGEEGVLDLLRLVSQDETETLLLAVTTEEQEVVIDNFTVLGPDETLGMRWSGEIDGQTTEGGLVVGVDLSEGATVNLLAGPVEEPALLIKVTSTAEAALALVRLCTQVSFGYDPGEDGGLGAALYPWTAYCGCRWGGGSMTLCAGRPPPCFPWGPAPCPPLNTVNCRWFFVWGVVPDWVNATGQQ
jgi:hypothetical protein